jgi:hypothetical protein
MHDIVSSDDQAALKEWRNSELEELATVNVTVSGSKELWRFSLLM